MTSAPSTSFSAISFPLAVVPDVAARPVALPRALRRLDRDHVGTEIRQRLDAHRAEQEMVEADDANSLQQVKHAGSRGGDGGRTMAMGAADRKWIGLARVARRPGRGRPGSGSGAGSAAASRDPCPPISRF